MGKRPRSRGDCPERMNPPAGTGGGAVMMLNISPKFQAFVRFYLLQLLIPTDSYFEHGLSLALDAALVAFEGAE